MKMFKKIFNTNKIGDIKGLGNKVIQVSTDDKVDEDAVKRKVRSDSLNKISKTLDNMLERNERDMFEHSRGGSSGKSTISINGKAYSGNNVSVSNNKVYIDGKLQDVKDSKEIFVIVDGNINNLDVDTANQIKVNGNVNKLKTSSGDVEVSGNVETGVSTSSGDVDIKGAVGGNVKTMSGDVSCRKISGSVSSMSGDIN